MRESRVLIVGVGGLGCPAALYLAGAGVGTIGLADHDLVDLSNLHRQPLYTASDVGRPKLDAARDRIVAMDSTLKVILHPLRVDARNAGKLVAGYDVVLDGTDDIDAKYALNDACQETGIPLVHGAVSAWEGTAAVFPPGGPCYRCMHPTPAAVAGPRCVDEGVLGTVPGVVGIIQAQETIRLIVAAGPSSPGPGLVGRLWLWDARDASARTITLKRRPDCNCSVHRTEQPTGRGEHRTDVVPAPAEGAPAACPLPWAAPQTAHITVPDFSVHRNEFFLLDVREPDEFEEGAIPESTLIPLGSLRTRLTELPQGRRIVCICAVGGRSAHATQYLRSQGFEAYNLVGGMRSWLAHGGDTR